MVVKMETTTKTFSKSVGADGLCCRRSTLIEKNKKKLKRVRRLATIMANCNGIS